MFKFVIAANRFFLLSTFRDIHIVLDVVSRLPNSESLCVWFLVIQTHVSVTSVVYVVLEELLLEIDDTYTHSKTFVVSPQQHFQKNSTAHKGKLTCAAQAKNNKPPVAAVGKSSTYACCY